MLSYNSCSFPWLLVPGRLREPCSLPAHSPPRAERRNAAGSFRKAVTPTTNKTPLNTLLSWQENTHFPHPITNQSIQHTDTKAKTLLYYYTTKLKKNDKTSSVSWFFFQEMLCRVMKDAQLYHYCTALSVLHKFVKCKNFTHINNQLCIPYIWFLLRIYWHKYA